MQKDKGAGNSKKPADKVRRISRKWFILSGLGILVISLIWLWPADDQTAISPSAAQVNESPVVELQPERLAGRWQRTDGGYVIEIHNVKTDGNLEAGYFNPNPIRVARATWQNNAGKTIVVVELRDVNYPGSTYTLTYDATDDSFRGVYYQAVEGKNYDVEFKREK